MSFKIKILSVLFVMILVSFFLHYHAIKGEFVWDDYTLILNNPKIHKISYQNIKSIFSEVYFSNPNYPSIEKDKSGYYRPFANLSYALMYNFFKNKFEYWHIVNIIIHALNAFLFFIIFNNVLSNFYIALLSSFLFLIHPFHHQAIDYCTGLIDLNCTFFTLISLIYFQKYLNSLNIEKKYLALFIIFYLLSIFTKEINILAPLIIIFHSIYKNPDRIKFIISRCLIFPFLTLFYLIIRKYHLNLKISLIPDTRNIILYYYACIKLFFSNIGRILYPKFSFFLQQYYPLDSGADIFTFIGFLFILCSVISFIYLKKKSALQINNSIKSNYKDVIFFSLIILIISWIPISNFIPIHPDISGVALYFSDHLSYFYSTGIFIIISLFINYLYNKKNIIKVFSLMVLSIYLIFLSYKTKENSRVWASPEILYKTIYEKNNLNIGAILQLGIYYNLHNQPEKALQEYNKLISLIKPDDNTLIEPSLYAQCLTNLALTYFQMNDYLKSIEVYNKAISFSPDNFINYYGLGSALKKIGNNSEAKEAFLKSLRINPKFEPVISELN